MSDLRACLDREVVEGIDLRHACVSTTQRDLLRYVAECDRRARWKSDGCRDMAEWLSGRLGISNWTARRWVVAAHALEHLPRISEALEMGVLSLDKVLELARFATEDTERKLITWARRVSPAAVRRKADRAARLELADVQEAERARYLRWWWFDDGRRLGLEGAFPAADGAAITAALKRVADKLPDLPTEEDGEVAPSSEDRLEQRCADALFVLASTALAQDADADRASVVVHTTLDSCRPWGELEGGPVIHPEIARRLSCDARLQFVLTDKEGNALGIGRTSREPPPWLLRQLRQRDRCCAFPGCGRRLFLKAHHIWHWTRGGPTNFHNLVLVCHFHHKLVHEFGWDVRLNGSMAEWFRPDGRRYNLGPDPPEWLSTIGESHVRPEAETVRSLEDASVLVPSY